MAYFSAQDLRALADMLDSLTEATARTGVTVSSYGGEHLTLNGHVIRLDWEPPNGEKTGRYLVDYPDEQH